MDLKLNTQDLKSDGALPAIMESAKEVKLEVSREFHNFLSDIEDMIKETTSLTGEELAIAKAKLSKRVAQAKESVEEMGEEIAHRAQRTARVTNNYVHNEPWKAIGAGAAAGLLVGFLLARRS